MRALTITKPGRLSINISCFYTPWGKDLSTILNCINYIFGDNFKYRRDNFFQGQRIGEKKNVPEARLSLFLKIFTIRNGKTDAIGLASGTDYALGLMLSRME